MSDFGYGQWYYIAGSPDEAKQLLLSDLGEHPDDYPDELFSQLDDDYVLTIEGCARTAGDWVAKFGVGYLCGGLE